MMTRPALEDLALFISSPTKRAASRLVNIPALYDVLKHEEMYSGGTYPPVLLRVCQWLYDRGNAVLTKLIIHKAPPINCGIEARDDSWQKVHFQAHC